MLFNYDDHISIVKAWGKKHKFDFPVKAALPKVGYIEDEAAVGFLYQTDSCIGWIEWVYANPDKTAEERHAALDKVFSNLESKARELKITALFSGATNDAFQQVLTRNGFQMADKAVHNVKVLGA